MAKSLNQKRKVVEVMKLIHGMTPVEYDVMIASRYTMKQHDAQRRGIHFDLSLAQFRSLYRRKFCAYTGVALVFKRDGVTKQGNYATLERVDNKKGYVIDNVVVVSDEANSVKSVFESKCATIGVADAVRMFANVGKLLDKASKKA